MNLARLEAFQIRLEIEREEARAKREAIAAEERKRDATAYRRRERLRTEAREAIATRSSGVPTPQFVRGAGAAPDRGTRGTCCE